MDNSCSHYSKIVERHLLVIKDNNKNLNRYLRKINDFNNENLALIKEICDL